MAPASYAPSPFEHDASNHLHPGDITGHAEMSLIPLTNPPLSPADPSLRVIEQLFGALVTVPPNAWLFV